MSRRLPILTFHDLAEDGAVIATDPVLFERGMERLREAGFETLDLVEAVEILRLGEPVPARRVVITFADLTRCEGEQLEREIIGSKDSLESVLGGSVDSFAYPFGRFDDRSRAIVSRNFACACSDELGFASPSSDFYALERLDAYYLGTPGAYASVGSRAFQQYIRLRNIPRRVRRGLRRL